MNSWCRAIVGCSFALTACVEHLSIGANDAVDEEIVCEDVDGGRTLDAGPTSMLDAAPLVPLDAARDATRPSASKTSR